MKNTLYFALLVQLFFATSANCQQYLDDLIIEKYYIADSDDAEDPFSTGLSSQDTTFRVYVNLCEGCKLLGLFGDQNHLLEISSTAPFYNNSLGVSFGHQISPNLLNVSTVGIDSYLSLGATSQANLGVLKTSDSNGSIWPEGTSTGLLTNEDPAMGSPLTTTDGLAPLPDTLSTSVPPGFTVQPSEDNAAAYVSSVFGQSSDSSLFTSAYLESLTIRANQGMFGADSANNILLGQFTTAGELSFQLNLILSIPGQGVVRVVADSENLQPGEVVSAFLKYPPECGCTDPNYLEYTPSAPCDDGSCQELIVFGCTDTIACNYDPSANFNIQSLCCYGIDDCGELDPSLICEELSLNPESALGFKMYPNPASQWLQIESELGSSSETLTFHIFNTSGQKVLSKELDGNLNKHLIHLEGLSNGLYQTIIIHPEHILTEKLIIQN